MTIVDKPYQAFDWMDPLAPAERERILERIARAIVDRGLETPAILALEMHKPLAFLGAQSLIVGTPLLGPLLGLERIKTLSRLLNEPDGVDALVRRIDEMCAARGNATRASESAAQPASTGTED